MSVGALACGTLAVLHDAVRSEIIQIGKIQRRLMNPLVEEVDLPHEAATDLLADQTPSSPIEEDQQAQDS